MSTQPSPLTYEGVLEMFRETREQFRETREQMKDTDRKFQETNRRFQETDLIIQETARMVQETSRQMKKSERKISALGSRIGEIIERMVSGNIVDKFRALNYEVTQCGRNVFFENKKLKIHGEIDLFLDDGDIAILIEVKTTLETKDVRKHIERLEKYRRYADAKGGDKRRFIGAVAGAVVTDDAADFAQQSGLYVIVQSGKAVEIVASPEGFLAKEW